MNIPPKTVAKNDQNRVESKHHQYPLHIIDQLWVKYSEGKFGFSVQKQIWLDCGGQLEKYDMVTYEKMSDHSRLNDLKDILDLLYEKLGEFEKDLIISSNKPANFELKQRIKREIIPDIRRYETEYWEIYPQEAIIISEEEAETQLVKVEKAVTSIEQIPSSTYPSELISLLQEIRDKLDEQDKAASAKLKVVLPLIPAIASYELEMDTEGFMYQTWKAIKGMVRR